MLNFPKIENQALLTLNMLLLDTNLTSKESESEIL